jgi:hypothetical protein
LRRKYLLFTWPEACRKELLRRKTDLRAFGGYEPYAAVIGNPTLRQFRDAEPGEPGARLPPSARTEARVSASVPSVPQEGDKRRRSRA